MEQHCEHSAFVTIHCCTQDCKPKIHKCTKKTIQMTTLHYTRIKLAIVIHKMGKSMTEYHRANHTHDDPQKKRSKTFSQQKNKWWLCLCGSRSAILLHLRPESFSMAITSVLAWISQRWLLQLSHDIPPDLSWWRYSTIFNLPLLHWCCRLANSLESDSMTQLTSSIDLNIACYDLCLFKKLWVSHARVCQSAALNLSQ